MSNTNFPTSIDSNPGDPSPNTTLAAGNHATLHGFAQDAIIAIETYLGIIGSIVTTSITYLVNHVLPTMGGTGIYAYSKGDLIVGSGTNTLARLPIGTNGQILIADSTQTNGLAWELNSAISAPTGSMVGYGGVSAPTGWVLCDGSSYSTITYPNLAVALLGLYGLSTGVSGSYNANIIVVVAHGLSNGQVIFFSGSVPSGLSANTAYYVINQTTNTFQVSATSGGSAVTINSGGSGSLTYNSSFLVPDLRSRTIVGAGTGTKTAVISSATTTTFTVTGLTNASNNEFQTGQAVVFNATTAGNLSNGATYYVINVANNQFKVASSLANAQNGTNITLAGTETGNFLLTLTARSIANTGGEENHAMSLTELLAHTHAGAQFTSGSVTGGANTGVTNATTTGSTGGNAAMNNMQPFGVASWIIKT